MALSIGSFKRKYRPLCHPAPSHVPLEQMEIKQLSWNSPEVLEAPPERVWTAVDADGKQYLVAGFHRVNRLYCVITAHPWEKDTIEVRL